MTGWREVYDFWFPAGLDVDHATHRAQIQWWFQGGADKDVAEHFRGALGAAIRGDLAEWTDSPRGTLLLIVVLDQFPRCLYQGAAESFACDGAALGLTEQGLANGVYDALEAPWEKMFFTIPLVHAEGPDHLQRIDRAVELTDAFASKAPPQLSELYAFATQQPRGHRAVIERFGRFPHRNEALGRVSTPEEIEYLAAAELVNRRMPPA